MVILPDVIARVCVTVWYFKFAIYMFLKKCVCARASKEHAECMASKHYAAADEWLDEIERELKIARHWLAVAKSLTAQGGAK